jgi:hypothetical protein
VIALSIGATAVAHGIHYGVLGVGLLGLLALLGPQLVGGRQAGPARDEHALRVRALTEQLAVGGVGSRVAPALPTPVQPRPVARVRNRFLPLAAVSSAAAAGVHAAVGPAHFREQALFGLFFAGSALAQIAWSLAVATRPTRALLVAAVIGNSAVLLLWTTTRTFGLPGLLPTPEAVGPWDLCCGIWELVAVLCAARALHLEPGDDLRLAGWRDWDPLPRVWALGSVVALLLLTLVGASA